MTAAPIAIEAPGSSYRPGAVSRFLAWVDGLPLHGWWVYPALAAALLAWSQAVVWATGVTPVGTVQPFVASGAVYGPYTLAALAYLNRAAERALVQFWPATGWPENELETWRYAFTTIPGRFGPIAFVVGLAAAIGTFVSASADAVGTGPDRTFVFAAYLPSALLGYALLVLAVLQISRQLRLVARIHQEAKAVDPFDRVPVYAFSALTARAGLALLLAGYYALIVNGVVTAGNAAVIAVQVVIFGFVVACFIVPLWGIHDRLVREKELLLRDVEVRVSRLGEEMYRRVDGGHFDGTKTVSDALAGVQALRERIVRLPTWPWPPQLLRGFLSALLVPVIVYLLSRLIGGRIGA